jgi:hypothetical protein
MKPPGRRPWGRLGARLTGYSGDPARLRGSRRLPVRFRPRLEG